VFTAPCVTVFTVPCNTFLALIFMKFLSLFIFGHTAGRNASTRVFSSSSRSIPPRSLKRKQDLPTLKSHELF
jgi:hypothetical protein